MSAATGTCFRCRNDFPSSRLILVRRYEADTRLQAFYCFDCYEVVVRRQRASDAVAGFVVALLVGGAIVAAAPFVAIYALYTYAGNLP